MRFRRGRRASFRRRGGSRFRTRRMSTVRRRGLRVGYRM